VLIESKPFVAVESAKGLMKGYRTDCNLGKPRGQIAKAQLSPVGGVNQFWFPADLWHFKANTIDRKGTKSGFLRPTLK